MPPKANWRKNKYVPQFRKKEKSLHQSEEHGKWGSIGYQKRIHVSPVSGFAPFSSKIGLVMKWKAKCDTTTTDLSYVKDGVQDPSFCKNRGISFMPFGINSALSISVATPTTGTCSRIEKGDWKWEGAVESAILYALRDDWRQWQTLPMVGEVRKLAVQVGRRWLLFRWWNADSLSLWRGDAVAGGGTVDKSQRWAIYIIDRVMWTTL